MSTPPGSSATVTITVTIGTALGTSTDSDTKTATTTGTAVAVFAPDSPPFFASQYNTMQISFAATTFNFQFFCIPIFGCQNLNATITNLQFTLVEPACAGIAGDGTTSFGNALMHIAGDYSTSGIAVTSGVLDLTAPASFSGHISYPGADSVTLDQLAMANQSFVVPPELLPAGVNSLTIVIAPALGNTTFTGTYAASPEDFDADNDGSFDSCDSCTDTDGDGWGNPGFPANTCTSDNCPDVFNKDQLDTDGNGIGDACEAGPPCPADISPQPDGDGLVNVGDLLAVIANWGGGAGNIADVNVDGAVDVLDLLAVIGAWGTCP
ncbi:MAG: dockerin type I domain-containing protein [Phycisphaerales bacterium]|nr:dockerin type I domain-containing protein [Phycisphaerales bacterium]MCI0676076.1 dockerin type I domain-containing protein [Phycisphaerales bacterium]